MGAMPEEINSVLSLMNDQKKVHLGNREYITGTINQIEIVLVFSRWGKVAAASTATTLINHFGIDQLIFTGVAGSVSDEFNIGDIVISEKLFQHDMDPTPLLPKYQIPLTDYMFMHADKKLQIMALESCEFLAEKLHQLINQEHLKEFNISSINVGLGTIASGDSFIASAAEAALVKQGVPETTAVEMEGSAVAQVCQDYKLPFVVIRTISDNADSDSHIDFPLFIKEIASAYTKVIVQRLLLEV